MNKETPKSKSSLFSFVKNLRTYIEANRRVKNANEDLNKLKGKNNKHARSIKIKEIERAQIESRRSFLKLLGGTGIVASVATSAVIIDKVIDSLTKAEGLSMKDKDLNIAENSKHQLLSKDGIVELPKNYNVASEAPIRELPVIELQEVASVLLKPEDLNISDKIFEDIAQRFTNEFEVYYGSVYLPAAKDTFRANKDGLKLFEDLLEWSFAKINGLDHRIAEYARIHCDDDNGDEKRAKQMHFLNTLLGSNGKILEDTNYRHFIDFNEITRYQIGKIQTVKNHDTYKTTMPLLELGKGLLPGSISGRSGSTARYINFFCDYATLSPNIALNRIGINGEAFQYINKPNSPAAVLKPYLEHEGIKTDHDDEVLDDIKRHELIHAIAAIEFPKASHNLLHKKRYPVQSSINLFGTIIEIKDSVTPGQCNELVAHGGEIANFSDLEKIKFINKLLEPSYKAREEDVLYKRILEYALYLSPGLSEKLKAQMEINDGMLHLNTNQLFEIVANDNLTKKHIHEIGKAIFNLGLELFSQIEDQVSKQ